MRTTITLDDDLADALRSLAYERSRPFKQIVNDTLRSGLAQRSSERRRFVQTSSDLRVRPGVVLNKALQLVGELDDEEQVRKLQQRR